MSASLPETVDAWRMVTARRSFAGTLPLASLRRLVPSLAAAQGDVRYALQFDRDALGTAFIGVQAEAALPLTCQRTLEPFDLPVRIDTRLGSQTQWLNVLGMPGMTGYFGLMDVGQPRAGETVVVSTAAGSVGSCVGQIANIHGCRTVGIAGGADKARQCVEEFGYSAGIDYKHADVAARLADACPDGVDVYFDNTSGAISDAVLGRLNVGARVVICGTASVANWNPPPLGPRVERTLLTRRARMQGFVIFDYAHRQDEAVTQLRRWIAEGKLRYKEDILDGIEACPDAIAGLYRGENRGKRLIRLA